MTGSIIASAKFLWRLAIISSRTYRPGPTLLATLLGYPSTLGGGTVPGVLKGSADDQAGRVTPCIWCDGSQKVAGSGDIGRPGLVT